LLNRHARIADRQTDRAGSIAAQGKAKSGNCDKPRSHTGRHVQSRAMGRRQNGRRGIKRRFADLAKTRSGRRRPGNFVVAETTTEHTLDWLTGLLISKARWVVEGDSFDQFDLSTFGIQAASVLLAKGDYKEILAPPPPPG
jgi:hypothetical protein